MGGGEPAGGSLHLVELIDEHGPWLAGDLLSEFGIRLADILFDWSPREVLALVEVLPESGRFQAHLAGGDQWRDWHGWGVDRHLWANLYDLLSAAHTSKGKPTTYPRPAAKKATEGVPLMSMFPRRKG